VNILSSTPSLLSIRALLIERLQVALQSEPIFQPASKAEPSADSAHPCLLSSHSLAIALTEIPLNRLKMAAPIRYVSAIAFRLAQRPETGKVSLEVARAIAEQLDHLIGAAQTSENAGVSDPVRFQIWQNFTIQTAEPGWIYLQLNDRGVAIWLQSLIGSHMPTSDFTHLSSSTQSSLAPSTQAAINLAPDIRNSTNIFPLLHTHARCCSLLRLANQTGIIRLDRAELGAGSQIFPWLNPESAQLRCQHPAEQQLISQLVSTLDQLSLSKQHDRKLAQALSRDFQSFHAACRIWGEGRTDLPLAQTRLGLIWIVQKVMRSLLAEWGIDAPIEL
jgi:DALR anticodon binding domain